MIDTGKTTLCADLRAAETKVWDALVKGDADADARLLSPDFLGIYPDGFSDKEGHTGQLASGPTIIEYQLDSFHARGLGETHGVLSYRATFVRAHKRGQEEMYVTSIWERTPAGWINILSQDTPAQAPDQGI